jgi:hypothetical protein
MRTILMAQRTGTTVRMDKMPKNSALYRGEALKINRSFIFFFTKKSNKVFLFQRKILLLHVSSQGLDKLI